MSAEVAKSEPDMRLSAEMAVPNDPASVARIREFVSSFLDDAGVDDDISFEIVLSVDEVAANASLYARQYEGRDEIWVRCTLDQGRVHITVADNGPGFDRDTLERRGSPEPLGPNGRGFFIVKRLMDDLDLTTGRDGTTVTIARQAL